MRNVFSKKGADLPRRRKASESAGNGTFRRNRTLTGSLSSVVSSATEMHENADLRSPRAHIHHLSAHRRRLSAILMVVIVCSAFLLWLLYEFTAGIHISALNSSAAIDSDRYTKAISSYLGAHPVERLRFALNEKQLTNYLQREVPEVLSVETNGSAGFATGQFDITFRRPIASWLIGSDQYFVDKDGVSFKVNYFDQPAVKIVDQSGVEQAAGTAIASSRFLQFVGRMVDTARSGGTVVEQAIIPVGTTRQLEVKIVGHDYPIKFSLDRPVGEQVEDMQRAVAFFDTRNVHPQYIDVRVSGKAYYK